MLAAAHRLKKRADFDRVFQGGTYWKGTYFRLRSLATDPETLPTQIGIVVSKKFSKLAVRRNRMRRQVAAIFREHFAKLKPGLLIVVLVSHPQVETSFAQLREDLTQLLKKAQILYGD